MRTIALICVAALIATAAAAQDTALPATPSAFEPQLEPRVSQTRTYPVQALERGVQGLAYVCCTVQADRMLQCRDALEWPERSGFTAGASGFLRDARLTEASAEAWRARSQAEFPIGMLYQIGAASPELSAIAAQTRARATDICGAGTGLAPEFIVVTASRMRRR